MGVNLRGADAGVTQQPKAGEFANWQDGFVRKTTKLPFSIKNLAQVMGPSLANRINPQSQINAL
jgi:hypothetical protein